MMIKKYLFLTVCGVIQVNAAHHEKRFELGQMVLIDRSMIAGKAEDTKNFGYKGLTIGEIIRVSANRPAKYKVAMRDIEELGFNEELDDFSLKSHVFTGDKLIEITKDDDHALIEEKWKAKLDYLIKARNLLWRVKAEFEKKSK